METKRLVTIYKRILTGDFAGWALFHNGTCVVIPHVSNTIRDDAIMLLRTYGQVIAGTPQGDFTVVPLKDKIGWVVTGDHPDILNFIAPDEVKEKSDDRNIGLAGRGKKELDAKELIVIHTEEKK